MRETKIAKEISGCVVLSALFFSAVFLEVYLRVRETESIPIDASEVPGTTVTSSRRPDFLWAGTAWWIDTESPVPFELEIDSSKAEIPKGTHTIFSNHDYNNLREYGLEEFRGDFPEKVTVRPTGPHYQTSVPL